MINVKVNNQWDILLPEHRAARPEWTTKQGWERARMDSMFNWVVNYKHINGKEPIVYYVGAEEGDIAALVQMWGAKLFLFEPNQLVWPNIKAIWQANNLKMPVCIPAFAANETDNDYPLSNVFWPECANGDIIIDHGFKNLCEADGTIKRVKIDDIVANGMPVPNMITLDVEGAEWEVLRGAEQILRKNKPVIYLSLHPEFMYEIYKEYSNDLRWWLKQMGYTETLLDYQHEVHLKYEVVNNAS